MLMRQAQHVIMNATQRDLILLPASGGATQFSSQHNEQKRRGGEDYPTTRRETGRPRTEIHGKMDPQDRMHFVKHTNSTPTHKRKKKELAEGMQIKENRRCSGSCCSVHLDDKLGEE